MPNPIPVTYKIIPQHSISRSEKIQSNLNQYPMRIVSFRFPGIHPSAMQIQIPHKYPIKKTDTCKLPVITLNIEFDPRKGRKKYSVTMQNAHTTKGKLYYIFIAIQPLVYSNVSNKSERYFFFFSFLFEKETKSCSFVPKRNSHSHSQDSYSFVRLLARSSFHVYIVFGRKRDDHR